MNHEFWYKYSKTCLKRPLKIDKPKVLKSNGSLVKVESIVESPPWSILQYFWPALSNNRSWKPILVFFLSGCLRQDLLNNQNRLKNGQVMDI